MDNRITLRKGAIFFLFLSILCFSILSTNVDAREEKTFGEIRKELLGKQVYIYGHKFKSGLSPTEEFLMGWEIVQQSDDEGSSYKYNRRLNAPYSLKGTKGIVTDIRIKDTSINTRKETSAFGDKIADDDIVNPYLTIIVKLNDTTSISCNQYYSTAMDMNLRLASKVDSEMNEINSNINAIIGKVIYQGAGGYLYPPNADIDTMIDPLSQLVSDIEFMSYGLLTPLKIIRAKYIESENAILLQLQFKDGKLAITLIKRAHYDSNRKLDPKNYWDNLVLKGGFLEKLLSGSGFLTRIPNFLTKKEIAAIKKRSIFRGMSTSAMMLSWGYKYERNDWGRGGDQYIYSDTNYVYVKNGKIVDWQSLSN